MTKAALRGRMKEALARLDPTDLQNRSALVCKRLAESPPFAESRTLLVFLSMPHEVITAPLVTAAREAGKSVAAPEVEGDRLVFRLLVGDPATLPRDSMGIPVPDGGWPTLDIGQVPGGILVVVPGLAFDRSGNRLGRGKGYYDRFLREARHGQSRLVAAAVCLSEQLVESVPVTSGDQKVDLIVTERELIVPRRA